MKEKDLIDLVAKTWIEGGGDAEGIVWCWGKIRERVKELMANPSDLQVLNNSQELP